MVSVAEASSIVFSRLFKPAVESVPFHDATNKVLAERILADRDFPPLNRVSMDGIGISFKTWEEGRREFPIAGIQAAGVPQQRLKNDHHCIEVMTGAVLPEGTDTVIPYEHIEIRDGSALILKDIVKGQSIHGRGSDAKKEDVLLEPGTVLSPAEIALLATVGKNNVKIFSFPRAAVISSGDELVTVETKPEAHQIRRSNTFALQAAMRTLGWDATLFHLPDNKDEMTVAMKEIGENFEVIILSGGVSKGKYDYVPAVLEETGVTKLFQGVNQRPGKPFWFGVSPRGTTVFALPGNPVSTYMCFYRYIRPWLLKSMGVNSGFTNAILARDFSMKENLCYFLQVNVKNEEGKLMAFPAPGGGSGDLSNLKNVTGFLELPAAISSFNKGDIYPYIPFRS